MAVDFLTLLLSFSEISHLRKKDEHELTFEKGVKKGETLIEFLSSSPSNILKK